MVRPALIASLLFIPFHFFFLIRSRLKAKKKKNNLSSISKR